MRNILKKILERFGIDSRYADSKRDLIKDLEWWRKVNNEEKDRNKLLTKTNLASEYAHQKALLCAKEHENEIYSQRNRVVCLAAKLAMLHCMKTGLRYDPEQPEWPVVMIDLPNGQVSWHISRRDYKFYFGFLHEYVGEWDGHDMVEKHKRICDFASTDFTTFNESLGRRVRGQWRCHCGKLHMVNERFCQRCSKPQSTLTVMEQ